MIPAHTLRGGCVRIQCYSLHRMDITLPSDVAKQVKRCKVCKLSMGTHLTRVQRCNSICAFLQQVLVELEADLQRSTSQGRLQVGTGLVLVAVLDLVAQRKCCHLQASPLEKAELYVTVAQAIQTMFCMFLRLHGISPEEHPIAKEEVSTTPNAYVGSTQT